MFSSTSHSSSEAMLGIHNKKSDSTLSAKQLRGGAYLWRSRCGANASAQSRFGI